ncbi:MAG: hypothetical protein KGR16_06560 [Verrucomicrobia bacterium]|nr:hypothetical protein [Verrucomicrobiota bacterium]
MTPSPLLGANVGKVGSSPSIILNKYLTASFMLPDTHQPNDLNALNNGLASYFVILSIIEDALIDFLQKRYRSFDALIGNNSCYISSYIVFLIAQRFSSDKNFINLTKHAIKKIKNVKKDITLATNSFQRKIHSESLSRFLEENGLAVALDPDHIYLAMAYGCTRAKYKNAFEFEEISYEKLIELYSTKLNINFARKSAQKLVKHWQKTLSIFNIKTLQSHAKTIDHGTGKIWASYIADDRYILEDHRGRLCAPSLYTAALIYDKLTQTPGSILGLQVNLVQTPRTHIARFTLYFQVQDNGDLKNIDHDEFSSTKPVYMFTGCRYISSTASVDIRALKAEFAARDLKTLILAHEVTYRQYPKSLNAKDITPVEKDLVKEIESLKKMSGFSLEDPTDLCLVHIFVDDTLTQSLASYEPPIHLPQLNDYPNDSKSSNETHKRRVI